MSALINRIRDWHGTLPVSFVLLALLLWAPNLAGPEDLLYSVTGDSSKYQVAAEGVSLWIDELPSALGRMLQGEFSAEDRQRYSFDTGIIQHATSYVIGLGSTYALFGSENGVGRIYSLLLAAGAAGLLFAWVRRAFGLGPALISGLLFLAWPVHPYFATAIMTEMPMTFLILLALWALDRSRETGSRVEIFLGGMTLGWFALAKISLRALAVPLLILDLVWVWWAFRRSRSPREGTTSRKKGRKGASSRSSGRQLSPARFAFWRLSGLLLVLLCWGAFLKGTGLPLDPDGERARLLWTYRGTYVPDRGFESVGLGDAVSPALADGVRAAKGLSEDEKEVVIYRTALSTVFKRDPVGWFGLVAAKSGWFWEYPARKVDVVTWFGSLPPPSRLQPLVVLLALVGFVGACLRFPTRTLPAVTAGGLTLVHAITHMVSRYNVPALPLAFAYTGLGCFIIFRSLRTLAGERTNVPKESGAPGQASNSPWGDRKTWAWLLTGCLVFFLSKWLVRDVWVGWGVVPRNAYQIETGLGLLTGCLLGAAAYFFFRHHRASRSGAFLCAFLLPGLLCLTWWGDRESDRDPDRWFADLSKPGDRAVQEITLPADLDWRAIGEAELSLDLLPSLRGETDVVVRVNGTPVTSFSGRPENPDENFESDEYIHAVQNRYRRVRVALEGRFRDFVEARYPGWGMEYFPQWYRIPVSSEMLRAEVPLRIEVEVVASRGGGSVRLYGDQIATDDGKGRRVTIVPAFLDNPYYLSTYQLDFFANNRERGDYRLDEPIRLYSPATRAEFFREGESRGEDLSPSRGRQSGEFRIRLRTALKGTYVERDAPKPDQKPKPVWAVWPAAEDKRLSNDDLRRLSAHRHRFFAGWRVY